MHTQDPYAALDDALANLPYEESEKSYKRDVLNHFHAFFDMVEKFHAIASQKNPSYAVKASIANISREDRTAIGWIDISEISGTKKLLFTLYNEDIAIQDDEFARISTDRRRRFHIDEMDVLEGDLSRYLIHVFTANA